MTRLRQPLTRGRAIRAGRRALDSPLRRRVRRALRIVRMIVAGAVALAALLIYLLAAALGAWDARPLVALAVLAAGGWLGTLAARPFVMAIMARFAARRAVGGGALWWLFVLVRRLIR